MRNNKGSKNEKSLIQDLYEDMTNTLKLHSTDLISNAKILLELIYQVLFLVSIEIACLDIL